MKTKVITRSIATVAITLVIGSSVVLAQTSGASRGASQSQSMREAPIGHRQPRADQVPSEKNAGDPNNPLNKENAALDRKIKSICRGC